MTNLVIGISWEYFLGLIGTLIGIAYYTNGRFSRLETSVDWLTATLRDMTVRIENLSTKVFHPGSPITLTHASQRLLGQSGLRSFIHAHKDQLLVQLRAGAPFLDAYRVQHNAFQLFADLKFEAAFEYRLNQFAFANGISIDLLRRLGAICLRDLAVNHTE